MNGWGLGRSPIKPGAGKNLCKRTELGSRALRSISLGMQRGLYSRSKKIDRYETRTGQIYITRAAS